MTLGLTLAVVVLALVCFVGEWFSADVTAIFVMVTLMTLGLYVLASFSFFSLRFSILRY